MKIGQMKFIDKYFGFLACLILSFINIFTHPKLVQFDKSKMNKVLLMKFWGLGSFLLLSPTIEEIRKELPEAKITFFTSTRNKDICSAMSFYDELILLELDKGWLKFAISFLKNMFYLYGQRFDMVVDFEFFTRFSAVVTFFTFSKIKIGYHAWETWRGNIHNIKVPLNRYWHIMDNFYNLGSYIGLNKNIKLEMVKPYISKEDKEYVERLLKDSAIRANFISAHVNASDLIIERRWPYENFISLFRRLLAKNEIKIVFIGSKSEANSIRDIVAKIADSRVVDFVGRLSITQLAYLFERSKLVISNDSGPLHLAVAMEVPTVSFFGPETPVMYGPRGKNHTVFFKDIDCSPCLNVHDRKSVHCYWEKPKCMTEISVDEVFMAIEEKL